MDWACCLGLRSDKQVEWKGEEDGNLRYTELDSPAGVYKFISHKFTDV